MDSPEKKAKMCLKCLLSSDIFRQSNRPARKFSLPNAKNTDSGTAKQRTSLKTAEEEKNGKEAAKERAITDHLTMIVNLTSSSHSFHSQKLFF